MQPVEALAQLAGLRVAQVDAVADPQRVGRRAAQRRLDLAGALHLVQREARRQRGDREAQRVSGAGGQIAAAERGDDAPPRPAHHGQRVERRRPRVEGGVVVEQRGRVEARAGGDLGDDALRSRALDTAGSPAVDDQRAAAHALHRLDHRRSPLGDLGRRARLHPADGRAAQPRGRVVAHTRDLRLVAHDRRQFDARPARDLGGQRGGLLRRADRRARRADLHPPAQRPPREVDVQTHARGGRAVADEVEVLDGVDHEDRRALGLAQARQRAAVGRRIREEHVVEAVLAQPQRLAQREGHLAAPAVAAQDLLLQRAAAHGLGGQAQRRARGAALQVGGVGPERVEVDEGERRVEALERGAVSLVVAQATASKAWLTRASACAFCARGTERTDQRSNSRSSRIASMYSGRSPACLTL